MQNGVENDAESIRQSQHEHICTSLIVYAEKVLDEIQKDRDVIKDPDQTISHSNNGDSRYHVDEQRLGSLPFCIECTDKRTIRLCPAVEIIKSANMAAVRRVSDQLNCPAPSTVRTI